MNAVQSPVAELSRPVARLNSMPSFMLNHIVHRYHQVLQGRMRPAGISALKMRIIISLQTFGSLTVTELCIWAIAEQPTMSRALDSLEAQGLIARQPSETDNRLRLINLTLAGEGMFDRIYPEITRVNDSLVQGLSADQREVLTASLRRMLVNLQAV